MQLAELHEKPTLRVLSLGAGVQSTVMALMTMTGEIKDKPDCGIFADTQSEPDHVYEHLEWLQEQLDFPIHIVTAGDLGHDAVKGRVCRPNHFAAVPFYLKTPKHKKGGDGGMGRRQCTTDYKIRPIRKKVRELLGVKKHKQVPKDVVVEQWIGISYDEMIRAKEARDKWTYNRWPLLELELRRHQLIDWFESRYPGRTLAKSACIFCPFHDQATWRDMKLNDKKSWDFAVKYDKMLREDYVRENSKLENEQYLHRSCEPLDEVDFSNAEDKGQLNFLGECEGMCGV